MKTKVFKHSETVKSSNLIMLLSMIIICGIFLFTSWSGKSNISTEEMAKNFVIPMQHISFSTIAAQKLEKEKLLLRMKLTENALINKNETCQNSKLEAELTMAKLHDYLIAEKEPGLEVKIAQSIVFPSFGMAISKAELEENNSNFLKELKIQASEKTRIAVENYAFEIKLRDYLAVEKETPLELEDWMINKKCWCPELKESLAFSEEK